MSEFWVTFFRQLILSYFSVFGFSLLFKLDIKRSFFAGIPGAAGWMIYFLLKETLGLGISVLLASAALAFICRILAKVTKTTGTAYLVPAIIPLVPGSGIYYTIYYLLSYDFLKAVQEGANTLIISGAIVLGIALLNPIKPGNYSFTAGTSKSGAKNPFPRDSSKHKKKNDIR